MPRYAKVDPNTGKITEIRDDDPPDAEAAEWQEVDAAARVGDDAPEQDEASET